MPTIAIVGAGPGLGLAIAKVFGGHGFEVALISRSRENLDALVTGLSQAGVAAAGYPADVADRPSLVAALREVKRAHGDVEVLEYSPATPLTIAELAPAEPLDVTVENVQAHLERGLYGAITATREVIPDMLARGSGALFFTTGASSALTIPRLANIGAAGAALRNWALSLHRVVASQGVYVAHVPIAVMIGGEDAGNQPDTIAQLYWDMYTSREQAEHLYGELPDALR